MQLKLLILSFFTFLMCFSFSAHANSPHAVGAGAHYWRPVDDLDADSDGDSISYILAYRYDGGLMALHAELEYFPEDFGTNSDPVYSPQVLAILGDHIYAGIGAGILYSDGDFSDEPFFMLRAGFNILALGPVTIDINANYVFTDLDEVSDIDSDTITLGAMLRVKL